MLKKGCIIGLILVLAGLSALGYLLGIQRKEKQKARNYQDKHAIQTQEYLNKYNQWLNSPVEKRAVLPWGFDESGKKLSDAQLKREQQERFAADLERLAAGEQHIFPFADQLYGKDWRDKLQAYKQRKEMREIVSVASVVCASTGGLVAVFCFAALLLWEPLKKLSGTYDSLAVIYDHIFRRTEELNNELIKTHQEQPGVSQEDQDRKKKRILKKRVRTLSDSGWQSLTSVSDFQSKAVAYEESFQPVEAEERSHIESGNECCRINEEQERVFSRNCSNTFPSGEDSFDNFSESEGSEFQDEQMDSVQSSASNVQSEDTYKPTGPVSYVDASDGQLGLLVQQAVSEKPNEISDTLKHLTQQVSAIRQYASDQQAKVKNLQAGYDWEIIKNFCLRIIRSIDNIEIRIEQLQQEGVDTTYLQEIRDELLFSLESSGVEQFRPHLKSEYRGLEKTTEVLKEREPVRKAKYKGCIAKVIRPGYQYCLNEDKVKVVRTAQVKLYG